MKIDILEALRYVGVKDADEGLQARTRKIAERLEGSLKPEFTYRVYDLKKEENGYSLENAGVATGVKLQGKSTERMLSDCKKAVLLACTLGAEFERLLRREQARDMADAVLLDALGSAYVEAGCNEAEEEIRRRLPDWYLTDRFSPGYGDLPLDVQREIFPALDIRKRLGVQLSDTLLMNPSKSVTAIIGLSERPQAARIRGCAFCSMRESCLLRKGGKHCGT